MFQFAIIQLGLVADQLSQGDPCSFSCTPDFGDGTGFGCYCYSGSSGSQGVGA